MSTPTPTSEVLLLFRNTEWQTSLSAEQLQQALDRFKAWFQRLSDEGKLKGGQPLEREGKVVSGKGGKIIADGPFAESKEAIGGYFLLQVDDFDEAVAIAQACPTLEFGALVEVRPVAEVCPTFRALHREPALASV